MAGNEAQRQFWNDPARVARWKADEPGLAAVAEPLLVAAAPATRERVVDIGCGGGLTTLLAAGRVGPEGSAVGIDLSAPFVELARGRAAEAGLSNATFEVGDAQTVSLAQAPFDAAISRFGVMFFDDPVAAFTNIRRQIRPGGRLAFACWQIQAENRWYPAEVLRKYAPAPPAGVAGDGPRRPAPGPFAFGRPEYVEPILAAAGFRGVAFAKHEYELRRPVSGEEYGALFLSALNLDAERLSHAIADLQAYQQEMVVDGVVVEQRRYFIVTARNAEDTRA